MAKEQGQGDSVYSKLYNTESSLADQDVCLLITKLFCFLQVWYSNVPHTKLAEYKGHQNWVKVSGDYLLFPGGGTQFKNGALHYIDTIQQLYYHHPSIPY